MWASRAATSGWLPIWLLLRCPQLLKVVHAAAAAACMQLAWCSQLRVALPPRIVLSLRLFCHKHTQNGREQTCKTC